MKKFIGRKEELEALCRIKNKKKASFIVVKGRRRIGKSRLIKEFSKEFQNFYSFAGLVPSKKTTKQDQIEEFSRQMSRILDLPLAKYDDWGNVFWALAKELQNKKSTLLLFDEISWMGSKDSEFLAQIKNLWDLHLSPNSNIMLVICGSASSWIDKNILSSTGFVGRISYSLTLKELSLLESSQFWPNNISAYEKLKILSVIGGVPKYLEEIDPNLSAEENIKELCFTSGGFLVDEFEKIFSDIFLRNSEFYKKIISILSSKSKQLIDIQKEIGENYGRISEYMEELESSGFVTRDYSWNIKTGLDSKLSSYRLSDNYLRFYIKYIQKNLTKIHRNTYALKSMSSLPEWNSIMGLQFENLVLNNRKILQAQLGINAQDIECENPFFQTKTKAHNGCQIDYMIQTKFSTLYICEIKFSRNIIGLSIIDELEKKIHSLKRPKGYSVRPVLIHVSGITKELEEEDYFANIIDCSELLSNRNPKNYS